MIGEDKKNQEIAKLQVEIETLNQLLRVQEQVTIEQSELLEIKIRELGTTVERLNREIAERQNVEEQQKMLLKDLEDMNKVMVGRELRMIELKKQINSLSQELGRPAPYEKVSE